ncbi:hypothetical protein [Geothrix sp. 21YS21S-4]|uniref:tetratricopeptide repeat protein n=1 Tax=Geothrix sp. 21YS21S-4 TaxID=3068889 RepID=UPI0027BAC62D|nr:hypothetical protein [Geothrix sp. 21YS21S-4]
MPEVRLRHFLPALMGSLRQQRTDGELVLEQNDGTRRLSWSGGELVYLRSDAGGEQFGNFLVRRGVLDMAALNGLLADGESAPMGERIVQSGLLSVADRDARLNELLGSILVHAMEHPILKATWTPGPLDDNLRGDLPFRVNHRRLVWDAFQSAQLDRELVEMFHSEPAWRWEARRDLLDSLSDFPLTPTLAYALSLLGTEVLGYEMIGSLSGLPQEEASRLVAMLWAMGGLTLVQGELPRLFREEEPAVEPEPPPPVMEAPAPNPPPAPMPLPPPLLPRVEPAAADMPPPPVEAPPSPEEETLSATERARRLMVKAKSYMMQARTSEAIRALEQSIKLDGDSPLAYDAWLLLGKLRMGNPAWSTRAVEALQIASRIRSRAAEPWALMGELYRRKGFQANAQGCFRRALELDPSVAVPADWDSAELLPDPREAPGGLMGKLRGMFGRDKG